MKRLHLWIIVVVTGVSLTGLGLAADWLIAIPPDEQATYVGGQTCAACHQHQHEQWMGSHHDLAMDLATPETVVGNFDNQELTYFDVTARMFRRDGKYFIHTDGPDGEMADFEIKYVIGVEPLQQYMVEFDDGRVQVLRESWDVVGQRWLYQYPPNVRDEKLLPGDPLHWTGRLSNWNHMCAECHTTNLHKNYDVAAGRYQTTFSEIDVSCETCHGPGSIHVKLAESKSIFWDRNHGYGLPLLKNENPKYEIESCAKCHARRRAVHPEFRPGGELLDYYVPQTLAEGLYHADGQILDEVYVYGSFVQSKMYAKGIRCTDCHDPHTTRLKHDGNRVCTSCHQHPEGKYDVPAHHHHPVGSTGAQCVECHMPSTHYMIVDPRRDHSLRVPRPDLSVQLGTPNACTACHLDTSKSDDWERYADWLAAARRGDEVAKQAIAAVDQQMAEAVEKWYVPRKEKKEHKPHFANALAAYREGKPEAEEALTKLLQDEQVPAIVRATALEELATINTPSSRSLIAAGLSDPDSLVRTHAVLALDPAAGPAQGFSDDELARAVPPLLRDPTRAVRAEAAQTLAPFHRRLQGDDRTAFLAALDEYRAGQWADRDQPEAHLNLGNLAAEMGDPRTAIRRYRTALELDENFHPARLYLGVIYMQAGDDAKAVEQFRVLTEKVPDMAIAHHRLGLALARLRNFDEAEQALLKAVELAPQSFDFRYILAIYYLERQEWQRAQQQAQVLVSEYPSDQRAQVLLRDAVQRRAPQG